MEGVERWSPVPGRPYEVSDLGRLRRANRVLHPYCDSYGYPCADLRAGGRRQRKRMHRLVAAAFIPNPGNKPEVNHIDADRRNNHVQNLEWVTRQENASHAVSLGLMCGPPPRRGEAHHAAKLTRFDVLEIRRRCGTGTYRRKQIADEYGVTRAAIGLIARKRNWAWLEDDAP